MLKSLAKAVVGVALLPVDAVADVVTLGGVLNDRKNTHTGDRARQIVENLAKATEPEDR